MRDAQNRRIEFTVRNLPLNLLRLRNRIEQRRAVSAVSAVKEGCRVDLGKAHESVEKKILDTIGLHGLPVQRAPELLAPLRLPGGAQNPPRPTVSSFISGQDF
jgi:hypothetical protein